MTSELHPAAEKELREAADWYAERSIYAGDGFLKAIEKSVAEIMSDPARYQKVGDGVRVYRLADFPHKLFYQLDEEKEHVRFLCVMHNKRRPDYWKTRLNETPDSLS